jgi:monoterpene epsilon-lactone hydrolase
MIRVRKWIKARLFMRKLIAVNRGETTVQKFRDGFEKLMSRFHPAKDIEFSEIKVGELNGYWVHTPKSTRDRVILYFHGGGYISGSTYSIRDFLGRLSKATECDILSIDYRLAPEHPFPAAIEDAVASYRFLLNQKISPSNIIVGGDSAGANLTLVLLLKLMELNMPLPRAAICISPPVDATYPGKSVESNKRKDYITKFFMHLVTKEWLQGHDPKDPYVSPTYGNLKGMPPFLVHAGGKELFLDDIEHFVKKAQEMGVKIEYTCYKNMFHDWHLFGHLIPEAQEAIDEIGEFVKAI